MKERPIIFTAESVRAILAGTKTQTRRIIKTRHPVNFIGSAGDEAHASDWGYFFDGPDHNGYMVLGRGHDERHNHGRISIPCPYGDVGGKLWVKETWRTGLSLDDKTPSQIHGLVIDAGYTKPWAPIWVAGGDAQNADVIKDFGGWGRWRSPLHLPRWASRLTLEVTEIRVQRLQDISEDDARAEGVEPYTPPSGCISPDHRVPGPGFDSCRLGDQPHRLPFADRWDTINGKRRRREYTQIGELGYPGTRTVADPSASWASNPFVWAISFKRVP